MDPNQRVTGIGGVFFKTKDQEAMRAWYQQHLGLDLQSWGSSAGTVFSWQTKDEPPRPATTTFSLFPPDSSYLGAGPFMVNYRVADLDAVLAALRAEGCQVDDKLEESEYGRFGWVTDPDGNRIELWQPPENEPLG